MNDPKLATPAPAGPATAAPAPGPRRATVAFIFVTVLIDVLAIGLIIPVLPRLVEQFMGGDTARAAGVFGAFGTAWALMQFLCSPILGSLSDRFGRRSVILLSCLGLGLDYDQQLPRLLGAVTLEEVRQAAAEVLRPELASVAIAGPSTAS